jgi:hypothetical protein
MPSLTLLNISALPSIYHNGAAAAAVPTFIISILLLRP